MSSKMIHVTRILMMRPIQRMMHSRYAVEYNTGHRVLLCIVVGQLM